MLEQYQWITAFPPPAFGVIAGTLILLSASLAVTGSSRDLAVDRFYVLIVAVGAVLSIFALSVFGRLVFDLYGGDLFEPGSLANVYLLTWSVIWSLGLGVLMIRVGLGTLRRWYIQAAAVEPSARLLALANEASYRFGYSGRMRVCVSHRCDTPFVAGVFRPTVYLPSPAETWWGYGVQRAVIAHEVAHIARRDPLFEAVTQVLGMLLWWNPMYWSVRAKIVHLREEACDEIVLGEGVDRYEYAWLLTNFASRNLGFGVMGFGTIHMAHQSKLRVRVERVLERAVPRGFQRMRLSRIDTAMTVACIVMMVAACDIGLRTAMYVAADESPWAAVD